MQNQLNLNYYLSKLMRFLGDKKRAEGCIDKTLGTLIWIAKLDRFLFLEQSFIDILHSINFNSIQLFYSDP